MLAVVADCTDGADAELVSEAGRAAIFCHLLPAGDPVGVERTARAAKSDGRRASACRR